MESKTVGVYDSVGFPQTNASPECRWHKEASGAEFVKRVCEQVRQ
ncbi:hypothetical protein CKA32_002146 [Geitlerinema sp. FC II]|nr:hypothetical protein [Baaleninema simplex]PPT11082.1 hypothetical protein CKA32_002146 [Geitlerinema sp. FC II]